MNNNLENILKKYWGFSSFRYPQREIIEKILQSKDVLAVLPTGFGKSLIYQVAGLAMEKPVIVISPLIALMEDQVNSLKARSISAESISGSLDRHELLRRLNNIRLGNYQFIFLSPERLQNPLVINHLQEIIPGFITVDEAHCVSEWGHDFRPDYLKIKELRKWFPDLPVLALTATAKPETREDIIKQLELRNPEIYVQSFYRDNLRFGVYRTEDKFRFVKNLLKDKKPAIIYTNTRKQSQVTADYLKKLNIKAESFHGGLTSEEKKDRLNNWLTNKSQVIVATSAFGMGIDKPDVKHVIHIDIPWSMEQYVQEAGRAGRNGLPANAFLVIAPSDKDLFLQRLEWQLPRFDYIKKIMQQLYSSHFIAEGEGEGIRKEFNPLKWAKKYGYKPYKLVSALKILESHGLILLRNTDKFKSEIQLTAPPDKAREYIEIFKSTSTPAHILELLIRNFPDIYDYPVGIYTDELAEKWEIHQNELKKMLRNLHKQGWVDFKENRENMEIIFLQNRQDSYLNMLRKSIENYLQIKREKALYMLRYTDNYQICRVGFIKDYFGENARFECGKCDICTSSRKVKFEDLENQILEFIKINQPIDFHALVLHTGKETETNRIVKELIEKNKIFIDENRNLRLFE